MSKYVRDVAVKGKRDTRFVHYDYVRDVIEDELTQSFNISHFKDTMSGCSGSNPRTWFGDSSYSNGEQCVEAIGKGWPKGLERADKEIGMIDLPRLPSVKRKRIRRDFGDELDIHRTMVGQHDKAWASTKRRRVPANAGGRITIFYNMGIHAGQDADELFWRGALASKLIDALEKTGRRVQLIVYSRSVGWAEEDRRLQLVSSVTVKQFNQTMAIDKVMATTAFAAFWRTIGFKMILLQPEETTYGLGNTYDTDKELRPLVGVSENDVKIEIEDDVIDKDSMMRSMEEILKPFK